MKSRNIFGGLLIVLLGIVFLLNNLGMIGWDIWWVFADFWPLILIALGVRLIFRRSVIVQIIVLIMIFVLPVAYYLGYGKTSYQRWVHPGGMRNAETYNWSLTKDEGIITGELKMSVGAGKISLKDSDMLATLDATSYDKPEIKAESSGNKQSIKIDQASGRFPMMPRMYFVNEEWAITLNRDVIWDLDVDTGAATAIYDLSKIKFSRFDLDSGAGKLRIVFGDLGISGEVDIDCGAGEVTLIIPESVGVEAKLHTGVGKKDLSGRAWIQKDDTYTSSNFEQAATKLNISLDAGVGAVSLLTQ